MAGSPSFDVDGPHSAEEIDGLVDAMTDGWTVTDAEAAEEGTDAVYFVTAATPTGEHEFVLKVCEFLDPADFRSEPRVMALVDDRTDLPVPGVIGALDDHEALPTPAFLMDRCAGEHVGRDELSRCALARLAHEAGRNLGAIHAVATFDGFGFIRLVRDTDGEPCVALPDGDGMAVCDCRSSWSDLLADRIDRLLGKFDERFADVAGPLRDALEPRIDALPDVEPVLLHDDYRYGNLLVDPETGATRAILDWGNNQTGHAEFDLATTEQYLCEWALPRSEIRQFVRERLLAGYEETNALERDAGFEERRETYLMVSRLMPMVWIDLWYADADEEERGRIAERHRDAVVARLDRGNSE